jgi:hypothetical protein
MSWSPARATTLRTTHVSRKNIPSSPSPLYIYLHIPRCNVAQRFARIAQTDAVQLAQLLCIGVAKFKEALNVYAERARGVHISFCSSTHIRSLHLYGASAAAASRVDPTPSSIWDIELNLELDLNSPSPPPLSLICPRPNTHDMLAAGPSKRTREESPPDIEGSEMSER